MTATPKWQRPPTRALTLAQHADMTAHLGRPVTDKPVGATTTARRSIDANASSAIRHTDDVHAEAMSHISAERQRKAEQRDRLRQRIA